MAPSPACVRALAQAQVLLIFNFPPIEQNQSQAHNQAQTIENPLDDASASDAALTIEEWHPFDAQEVAAIYQKRFGSSAPSKAIEAMVHWNLPNAQRAQVCYDLGQLTRLLFDFLKDHPDYPSVQLEGSPKA